MSSIYPARKMLLDTARSGLQAIGYHRELLREDYEFADPRPSSFSLQTIDLAAFAQRPPSYRNACLGVSILEDDGIPEIDHVENYRNLGAPQILTIQLRTAQVNRWQIVARGKPEKLDQFGTDALDRAILDHRADWDPQLILRAKSARLDSAPHQLDFFDAGLVPTIEDVIEQKLDELLRRVIAECRELYLRQHSGKHLDDRALFRLIFRLIAAKLLADRANPDGRWNATDPTQVIADVEGYYFRDVPREYVLEDAAVQRHAWDTIRQAFHLANVSVETLAYVYENTLVTPETRRAQDVHATPPEIAEYIVRHLPIEDLAQDERIVFEPFAGHAPFLIAALGRLRMLLPPEMDDKKRHQYFVGMLSGMEIDSFATEIARNSLSLADYPNPDGWRITNGDVFTSPNFDAHLSAARIVLCNPPFGAIDAALRQIRPDQAANKAVAALQRVLERPPKLLGFVLPRVFLQGRAYRDLRRRIAATYSQMDLVELPRIAFRHSDAETVLLIASQNEGKPQHHHVASVQRSDYARFLTTSEPTWKAVVPLRYFATPPDYAFLYSPIQPVLNELLGLRRLGEIADVHRGIEYNVELTQHLPQLVSETQGPGLEPGLQNTRQGFEPYVTPPPVYLNVDPALMRRTQAFRQPWRAPKVIANASRLNPDRWLIAAAVDYHGLYCYRSFHGIWPKNGLPLEVIAALINGPVANAFVSSRRTSRHIFVQTINLIPVPDFTADQVHRIVSWVNEYRSTRERWRSDPEDASKLEQICAELLRDIDAELLRAYDLPPRLERVLLDFFAGYPRPGPVSFDRYYPPDFRPAVPWHVYTSDDFRNSSARQTLDRLPVFDDPEITAALRDLDGYADE